MRHYTQRVVLDICGKRFEVMLHVEVREARKGLAKVIEMPTRQIAPAAGETGLE